MVGAVISSNIFMLCWFLNLKVGGKLGVNFGIISIIQQDHNRTRGWPDYLGLTGLGRLWGFEQARHIIQLEIVQWQGGKILMIRFHYSLCSWDPKPPPKVKEKKDCWHNMFIMLNIEAIIFCVASTVFHSQLSNRSHTLVQIAHQRETNHIWDREGMFWIGWEVYCSSLNALEERFRDPNDLDCDHLLLRYV